MSYFEYIDLFKKAQKKPCKYRAFLFDVKDCQTNKEFEQNQVIFHNLIEDFIKELQKEEKFTNTKILLSDKFNKLTDKDHQNLYNNNPMILGDMFTIFVNNNSITEERIKEIFVNELNKFNINYQFHFATGKYDTNYIGEASDLLFKGYVPQILEDLSKQKSCIIDRYTNIKINTL